MNARGSTEIIVASIGLSLGAITQTLYTMIVTMAVITTMAMPPMLRWSLSRVPLRASEKKRLERERAEAKEFVPNLERLLLAVDESPNGQFASYIAGLFASRRGNPITVLPMTNGSKKSKQEEEPSPAEALIEETIKSAAEANKPKPKGAPRPSVEVILRKATAPTSEEAVTTEAKKGYDLLLIGKDKMRTANGAFNSEVDAIANAFEGPLAIAIAEGERLKEPQPKALHILVPITGTEVSRRAAEFAFSLGKAKVTALYVGQAGGGGSTRKQIGKWHAREILKDMAEMAERYGSKIETRVVSVGSPAKAIAAETTKGKHNLIVMGVSRRPGEKLFFGDIAAAILAKPPSSILLLST
jgi:nucleotide-binding universal stress UspA family protein